LICAQIPAGIFQRGFLYGVPGKGKIQRLKILTAPGGRKGKIPQFAEMWNRPQKRNYLSMDSGCVQVAGEFLQALKNILKYFLTNTCTATIIYLRNL